MRETAYAKVNLALHVRAREPHGYHRLETVFAFAEDGDVLEVGEAADLVLDAAGPFGSAMGEAADNLVLRAAAALRSHYAVPRGARLTLDKRLPVASGIGGGSADAAAALRLLVRWWGLPWEVDVLHFIARGLGADVPACLESRTVRGEGRGDDLRPIDAPRVSGTPILLVNPLVPVPTGPVFQAWDGVDRGPLGEHIFGRNDLETPARALAPQIDAVLAALAGAQFVRMSGSGATCFALYETVAERDAAAARIGVEQPGWWQLASRLR